MKEKLFIGIITITLIFVCFLSLYYFEDYQEIYYTKIDNNEVEEILKDSEMKYEYQLNSFNKKGRKRKLKFKTRRKLKENAFLKLEVRTIGVHSWEEVQYNELPKRVKQQYRNHIN